MLEAERLLRSIIPADPDYWNAQTQLGFLLVQRSALIEAEEIFSAVLKQDPDNTPARLGLGVVLVRQGRPANGGKELEEILADPALGLKANTQWVMSLVYEGKTEKAFERAELLTRMYPSHAEFHALLGYLYQLRGETQKALQSYLQSVQLDPGDLASYFSILGLYRSQKDWPNALRWARSALVIDNNHPMLYQELSVALQNLGRSGEAGAALEESRRTFAAEMLYTQSIKARIAALDQDAEKLLRECIAKNPRLSKAWIDLGELLQRSKRPAEARQSFRNALEYSPQDARALLGLVTSLRSEGKGEEALRYLEIASEAGKLSPDLLTTMAAALQQFGRSEEAIAAVERALDALPDDPDLLAYLGFLQLSSGQGEAALASYTAALRLNPAQIDALLGQAQSQLAQGATRIAIDSLLRAQALDPSNTQVLKALFGAYRQSGERRAAESACRTCLKLDARDRECREQLAWLSLESEDYKEAITHFELVLKSGPESKRVHLRKI